MYRRLADTTSPLVYCIFSVSAFARSEHYFWRLCSADGLSLIADSSVKDRAADRSALQASTYGGEQIEVEVFVSVIACMEFTLQGTTATAVNIALLCRISADPP